MRYRQSTVGKLEKVSLRLNLGLLILLLLLVCFVVIGYWLTYKVIRGEVLKVDYHFMRFVGRASDHEIFLLRVIQASSHREYEALFDPHGFILHQTPRGQIHIYEGQASQASTTFSIALPDTMASVHNAVLGQQLRFGIALANAYNVFWDGSTFKAPQMFLFDPSSDYSIAVPSIKTGAVSANPQQANFPQVLHAVQQAVRGLPPQRSELFVSWQRGQHFLGGKDSQQILGYVSTHVVSPDWQPGGPPRELIVATLLNVEELDKPGVRIEKQFFDSPMFESVDIVAPDGSLVAGDDVSQLYQYENGFHFTPSGLLVRRGSGAYGTWQALYHISYKQLIIDARWQLFGLISLVAGFVICGWAVIRWYRRHIVVPASNDFRELLDNHDFNLSLLQTVPLALCVVKGPQIEPITQNSLYTQWLGRPDDFNHLMALWPLFEQGRPIAGEGCLIVDTRALHVRYSPTEYLGESVLLCTFTDISTHREASASMHRARIAADAANKQKSDFVATLSHELRTPLYGVLGTLELLALTPLEVQQRGYLQTINQSSAVLLQLISDVLDLSKIEAGQMVLESVAFEPQEMLEETVRSFSAMATNKDLALYCCIDPRVPMQVQGDRMRIQQIVSNLLNNAIKFTQTGHVAVSLVPMKFSSAKVTLCWAVTDTGPGMPEAVQAQLFERFYQAQATPHTVAGTGLGLSICADLSQMMHGQLSVDSAPGAGSTFVFELSLEASHRARPAMPQLVGKCIDVHTPFAALTDNLCAWLEHYGAQTCVMGDASGAQADVILQVMTQERLTTPSEVTQVFAQDHFSCVPRFIGQDVVINQHSVSGICRALVMAITGEPVEPADKAAPLGRVPLSLKVLVAEDNAVNQALMKEQLQRIGCTVDVVSDGAQALQQLDRQTYDVLLTDVNMPAVDGYQLAETLRQRDLDIPIIGVTANALREEGERCIRSGMNSWLSKPMDIQGLYLCLRSVLDPAVFQDVTATASAMVLVDEIQVPERMLELFLETIAQDLAALKTLEAGQGSDEVARLLHRIRGALAVGRAKSLISTCRDLENAVAQQGLTPDLVEVKAFVLRVEQAIAHL